VSVKGPFKGGVGLRKTLRALFFTGVLAASVCINSTNSLCYYYNTAASFCVNNSNPDADYKLTVEETESVHKKLKDGVMSRVVADETEKYVIENPERNFSTASMKTEKSGGNKSKAEEAVTAQSYLIHNNLLERPCTISKSGRGLAVTLCDKENTSLENQIRKSDFLLLLDKVAFGVKKSRPLVHQISGALRTSVKYSRTTTDYWNGLKLYREKEYWDSASRIGGADFSGDIFYFVTSNVYELHFNDLLNRGIIYKDEFGKSDAATTFISSYDGDKIPYCGWHPNAGVAFWGENAFGKGYKYDNGGYTPSGVSYFSSEELTKMDIYQYVEDILRQSEGNMSKMESEIVSYKFGLKFLQQYDSSEQKTLKYLIAKGMLDFENDLELRGLNEPATESLAYTMLYRYHNKGARFKFSTVKMTDTDAYWQENGYAEKNISINSLNSGYLMSAGTAVEIEDGKLSAENEIRAGSLQHKGLGQARFLGSVFAAGSSKQSYKVTMYLSTDVKWKYDGVLVADVENDTDSHSEIYRVSKSIKKYNGKKVHVYKSVFKVAANSPAGAIGYVKKRLSSEAGSSNEITCVTKVKGLNGKSRSSYSMVPQSAVKKVSGKISVIEDKVLLNTETGTQAILMPDLHCALVGNTVIHTNDFIMTETYSGGEVYYSLAIIVSLLDDAYLKTIGYSQGIYMSPKNLGEYSAEVHNEYGSTGETVHCGNVTVTSSMAKRYQGESNGSVSIVQGDKLPYYRVDDITEGLNTLCRTFNVSLQEKKGMLTVVVDWQFVIPSVSAFEEGTKPYNDLTNDKKLTTEKITKYLYTRPDSSKVLQAWWDSNYVANNALANFIYGTSNVEYIMSGYLVPNVHVLYSEALDKNIEGWLHELFNGFVGQAWGSKTGDADILGNYFSGGGSDWSDWYTSFYDGDDCFGWMLDSGGLKEDEYDELVNLANAYRTFEKCSGYHSTKYEGYVFGTSFLRTDAGVLYRSLDSDGGRCSYVLDNRGNADKITLVTRTDSSVMPVKDQTVIQIDDDSDHLMLYRGTKTIGGVNYYALSPISHAAVTKTDSPLYNGGYVQVRDGTSESDRSLSFILDDRSGNYIKNSPDSKKFPEYNWIGVYDNWMQEYLGKLGVDSKPSSMTCSQAFGYGSAAYRAASRNGVKFAWNFTYYSKGKFVQYTRSQAEKSYSDAIGKIKLLPELSQSAGGKEVLRDKKSKSGNVIARYTRVYYNPNDPGYNDSARSASVVNGKADMQFNTFAIPIFYVPVNDYQVVEFNGSNNVFGDRMASLVHGTSFSALRYGNYYCTGVSKAVQSAILSNYVKAKNINELGEGAQVSIAGIRFFVEKTGNGAGNVWLKSANMNMNNTKRSLREAARGYRRKESTREPFKAEILKLFSGMTIECDGKFVPFENYICNRKKKGADCGIQLGDNAKTSATNKYGVLYQKNGTAYGYKNKQSKKITHTNTTKYRYARVRLHLNGKLKVRPLDKDMQRWTLTFMTETGNLGYGGDTLIFYGEDLSYDDNQYANVSLGNTRFNPSDAFQHAMKRFQRNYRTAMLGDIKAWILMVIVICAMYLCIISWAAYLVLHYGVMRNFFEAVAAGPGKSSNRGVDIVKLATLGFYSLDSDPQLSRVVSIQLGCTIVAAIAYNMM
jgi:hypothetical protein